jgi:hypothetical protein
MERQLNSSRGYRSLTGSPDLSLSRVRDEVVRQPCWQPTHWSIVDACGSRRTIYGGSGPIQACCQTWQEATMPRLLASTCCKDWICRNAAVIRVWPSVARCMKPQMHCSTRRVGVESQPTVADASCSWSSSLAIHLGTLPRASAKSGRGFRILHDSPCGRSLTPSLCLVAPHPRIGSPSQQQRPDSTRAGPANRLVWRVSGRKMKAGRCGAAADQRQRPGSRVEAFPPELTWPACGPKSAVRPGGERERW